jgi:hypothetical protein
MAFSTATAEDLRGKSPEEIRDFAEGVAEERRSLGGETQLIGVFFDVGKEVGYALYKDLGNSADIKKASRKFGAIGITKLLDADQMGAI